MPASLLRGRLMPERSSLSPLVVHEAMAPVSGALGVTKSRMAERIASAIEQRMVDQCASVGDRLGREADLATEFGVSRWTMREALAQLMHAGAIEARRGAVGGLYVAAPAADFVRHSIVTYLESIRVEAAELTRVRQALARVLVERLRPVLSNEGVGHMGELMAQMQSDERGAADRGLMALHAETVRAAGHPALELLYTVFGDLLVHAAWLSSLDDAAFQRTMDSLRADRTAYLQALLAERFDEALKLEVRFGRVFEQVYGASALMTGQGLPQARMRAQTMFPAFRLAKKTEQLAWALRERIVVQRLEIGSSLGSEAELMALYSVGRATLREAVRSLERLGLVKMAHGGGGGLKVIQPDPGLTIACAQRYLRSTGLTPAMRVEIRDALRSTTQDHAGNRVAALFVQIVAPT